MLVSHRHRFIFIHTYKTAGTSVRRALEPFVEDRWRFRTARFTHRLGLPFPRTAPFHLNARQVREWVSPEVFERYFKFAFARNPWDWQVSLYHWTLNHPDHFQHDLVRGMGGFEPYIRWRVDGNVVTQKTLLSDDDGTLLVDYVGRMETLHDDFAEICRIIGLSDLPLPHKNRSSERDYRTYYTEETGALVARAFAEDVELFGYTFDGPVERDPRPGAARPEPATHLP